MAGLLTALLFLCACLGLCSGCGMDEGSSGEIPRVDVFLTEQGSLEGSDPIVHPVTIPYGVSLLEVNVEVFSGEADLIVGTEDPPTDYFSPAHGAGFQKLLLSPASREPLQARTWYIELVSPFGVDADYQLNVRRRLGQPGSLLLEEEGQLPARQSALFPFTLPEDAISLEVILESRQGDMDLFLGIGPAGEEHASLNPGTGFEVIALDSEAVSALTGQTLAAKIESFDEDGDFRLTASYVAASPGVSGTTGSP